MNGRLISAFTAFAILFIMCMVSNEFRSATYDLLAQLSICLARVPAQFWATFSGSLFTLLGVWFTNHYTDKRAERAHEHERNSKKLDREMALRRDVYLAAAEAISHGMQMLPNYCNPLMPDHDITKEFLNKAPAIAKVQVVSDVRVSAAILKVVRALSDVTLDIGPSRASLMQAQATLTDKEKIKDARLQTREAIAAQMLEGVRSGAIKTLTNDPNPELLAILDEAIAQETRAVEEARNDVRNLTIQTFAVALSGLNTISSLLPEAYLAVREELSLDVDAEAFKAILDEHARLAIARISEALLQTPDTASSAK